MVYLEKEQEDIIHTITEMNGIEYNLSKASEELQELSLILTQKLNKPHKVKDENIHEEIGDVLIRMSILQKIFDQKAIQERIAFKLSKFKTYADNKLYKKI